MDGWYTFWFFDNSVLKKVLSDLRLQSWALAISEEGGLSGFPRNIHSRELLARSIIHWSMNTLVVQILQNICRVLTMVIFGGSVLHHALNAPHYLYSYAPHRPTSLSRSYQVIIVWTNVECKCMSKSKGNSPKKELEKFVKARGLIFTHLVSKYEHLMTRWMPDPENDDITWDWIKETLPSLKQQEILYMTVTTSPWSCAQMIICTLYEHLYCSNCTFIHLL